MRELYCKGTNKLEWNKRKWYIFNDLKFGSDEMKSESFE